MSGNLIPYDSNACVFSVPEVPYAFFPHGQTFEGGGAGSSNHPALSGVYASITAVVDTFRNVHSGTVRLAGGGPSLPPGNSLLLLGTVLSVETGFVPSHFWASFLYRIRFSHPSLGYTSPLGVWNAFFRIPGWTGADLPRLFSVAWGPATTPLNSYIGQVRCLF